MNQSLEDALEITAVARNQLVALPAIRIGYYNNANEIAKKLASIAAQIYQLPQTHDTVSRELHNENTLGQWTNILTLSLILMDTGCLTNIEKGTIGRIIHNKIRHLKALRLWDSGAEACILNNILR